MVICTSRRGLLVFICPSRCLVTVWEYEGCCPVLPSRSGDSTARIWDLSQLAEGGQATSISLPHSSPDDKEKPKDVTTLDWSGNGQLLATGSYDGLARVWSREGMLHMSNLLRLTLDGATQQPCQDRESCQCHRHVVM